MEMQERNWFGQSKDHTIVLICTNKFLSVSQSALADLTYVTLVSEDAF